MGLDFGADGGKVEGVSIVDEEHAVRVADRHRRRLAQSRHQLGQEGRIHVLRQRDGLPPQVRRAHADAVATIVQPPGGQHADDGFDRRGLTGFLEAQPGDAAGGIATGLGLTAVRVENAHEDLRRRVLRRFEHDQLVTADAKVPVSDPLRLRRRRGKGHLAGVNDDEIVAQAVHLYERSAVHSAENRSFLRPPLPLTKETRPPEKWSLAARAVLPTRFSRRKPGRCP